MTLLALPAENTDDHALLYPPHHFLLSVVLRSLLLKLPFPCQQLCPAALRTWFCSVLLGDTSLSTQGSCRARPVSFGLAMGSAFAANCTKHRQHRSVVLTSSIYGQHHFIATASMTRHVSKRFRALRVTRPLPVPLPPQTGTGLQHGRSHDLRGKLWQSWLFAKWAHIRSIQSDPKRVSNLCAENCGCMQLYED